VGSATSSGTLEQIHTVLDEVDNQYASFTLPNERVCGGIPAMNFTTSCDNYLQGNVWSKSVGELKMMIIL